MNAVLTRDRRHRRFQGNQEVLRRCSWNPRDRLRLLRGRLHYAFGSQSVELAIVIYRLLSLSVISRALDRRASGP